MGQTLPSAVIPMLTPQERRDVHLVRLLIHAARAVHDVLECAALRRRLGLAEADTHVLTLRLAQKSLLGLQIEDFDEHIRQRAAMQEMIR